MDKLLMFLAYMGLVFGSLGTLLFALCCLCKGHDVFTRNGKLANKLLALQGKRVVYPFRRAFLLMVIGLGWFLTWKYG